MRGIKLCMQFLRAARRPSRAAHAERCHWSEVCNNNLGVTAGKASHNTSNARAVTAGKMGRNSSDSNNNIIHHILLKILIITLYNNNMQK